jgi:GNAT superfamily N-acetyltransferase
VWWRGPINERFAIAASDQHLIPALAATGLNVWVVSRKEPTHQAVRIATAFPVSKIACQGDASERYWRASSHWKRLREARNRTRGFAFEIDVPGAAEWVIQNWARKWNTSDQAESDLLLADDFYRSRGLARVAVLRDGAKFIAGCVLLVHGHEIAPQVNFYSQDYRWHGVMTSLYDHVVRWAGAVGMSAVDFGVSYNPDDYKASWAPRADTAWMFNTAPTHLHLARSLVRSGTRTLGAIRRRVQRRAE